MKKTMIYILIVALIAIFLGEGDKHKPLAHWGYNGDISPNNWFKLDERYNMCKDGKHQSPINIVTDELTNVVLEEITYYDDSIAKSFENNGHTLKVNFLSGNMIEYGSKEYALKQMHFHTPSENKIDGKTYPMEAHLVHKDSNGNILVIAVMFELSDDTNVIIDKLLKDLPTKKGEKNDLTSDIYGYDILPQNKEFYTFDGSLTTPPCSENVKWIVLKNPVNIIKTQLEEFKNIMQKNNRPIQSKNNRYILG
ncbi:carbonic anhydrase [Arcobacter sp. CECT 8985]|uniref:carbonic anhydrase n=1 Tax=Arcobacter sp. CECT 8985 TaxID=1935424 RepID=UPI00100A525D|nr:carbonic anhydrase family protein [Arcobacter sp. CECT 8985]RXJ88196.1 carbonic anhydrase [Arcobacter sp. CECT 8985]